MKISKTPVTGYINLIYSINPTGRYFDNIIIRLDQSY